MGQGATAAKVVLAAAAALIAVVLTAAVALAANPAALDTSFSGDGTRKLGFGFSPHNDEAKDVAVTPGGKVIAAGRAAQNQTNASFAVARLTVAGRPDPSFAGDGRRVIDFGTDDDSAEAVALQRDGKVVLAGYMETAPTNLRFAIARLTPAGQLDPTFSGDGKQTTDFTAGGADDEALAVAIQPNGRIVAAGISEEGGDYRVAVARYLPNGSLDDSFSGDGKKAFGYPGRTMADADGIAIAPNGRLVIAGQAYSASTNFDFAVAALLPNGAFDGTFSQDGRRMVPFDNGNKSDGANAVALDGRRIVLAGYLDVDGLVRDFAVARLREGGALDTTFSGDGRRLDHLGVASSIAEDVAVQPNGKILAAGAAVPVSGDGDFALIRYRPNGTPDPGFSGDGVRFTAIEPNSDATATGIALDRDGRIVLAGRIYDDGGATSFAFARHRGGP